MKKTIIAFICFMLMLSTGVSAVTVEFVIGDTTMAKVQNDTSDRKLETSPLLSAPYIANDRTMVPIRALSESFNCHVNWNADLREVEITNSDKVIKLYIDSHTAYVNEAQITMDTAPQIQGDITFVPVRFVTENMGYNVAYIPQSKSVLIYDKNDFKNDDGQTALYPSYDLWKYIMYRSYGVYPDSTYDPDGSLDKMIKSSLFCYDYLDNIAKENSLSVSDEFIPDEELINSCYTNNILKGEYAKHYYNLGAEDAVLRYFADAKIQEILEFYEKNYVCTKHILISSEELPDAESKKLANKVYKLANNGSDFDELIKEYGEDPGMLQNPDGYVFTKGEMVEAFESESFNLKEGAISKPVKSEFGYHIILRLPLPEISEEIKLKTATELYMMPILEKFGLK